MKRRRNEYFRAVSPIQPRPGHRLLFGILTAVLFSVGLTFAELGATPVADRPLHLVTAAPAEKTLAPTPPPVTAGPVSASVAHVPPVPKILPSRSLIASSALPAFIVPTAFVTAGSSGSAGELPGIITTFAGGGPVDGIQARAAAIPRPAGVVRDRSGNLFFGSYDSGQVYKVDTSGRLTAVAKLSFPNGMTVDAADNVLVADIGTSRIVKLDGQTGTATVIAGGTFCGFCGDGGPATNAGLNSPYAVTVDKAGDLFIADSFNHRIRRVDALNGTITTVAGTGTPGFNGDGISAIAAELNFPVGVAVDLHERVQRARVLARLLNAVRARRGVDERHGR